MHILLTLNSNRGGGARSKLQKKLNYCIGYDYDYRRFHNILVQSKLQTICTNIIYYFFKKKALTSILKTILITIAW